MSALAFWGGLLACSFGFGLGASLDDPRRRFAAFALSWALAAGGSLLVAHARPRGRRLALAIVIGLLARWLALSLTPAFSSDVFRYRYEGAVAIEEGPLFPYRHPPADGRLLKTEAANDPAWKRINHPELATLYPPVALGLFALASGLGKLIGSLLALQLLFVGADLALWRVLHRIDPGRALLWGLSPLVVWEIGREGHVDGVAALGLWGGALALERGYAHRGHLAWALAGLTKLTGFVLAPLALVRARRGAWIWVAALAVLVVPYGVSLGSDAGGVAAYATRWRAGDGAFSGLLWLAEQLLGGDWHRFERLGVTLTRHQLARALAALGFGGVYLWTLRLRANPVAQAGLLLLGLLLLSPTVHPWYLLWVLPFAGGASPMVRAAILWLASSAVLLHLPTHLELLHGQWREPAWARLLVHGPAWGLLLATILRWRGSASGGSSKPCPSKTSS